MDRAEIERRWAWRKPFASRYGLAVLCVAGPLIFGSVAPDLALRYLMPGTPHTLVALLPHAPPDATGSRFDFRPDVSAKSDRAAATSGASSKDRGAEETDEIVARDRNTLFGARDIGGRVRYVVASAFLCAVSIAAFGYGAAVVVRRRGRLPPWGPWAVFGGFALLSIWLAFNSAGFERIRPLIVESILEAADAKQAWQTASRALVLVRINTWVALVAVGTLLTALYTASLLAKSQQAALKPMGEALTLLLGEMGTIALFAAMAPALAAFMLDVHRYRAETKPEPEQRSVAPPAEPAPKPAPPADDGLGFAPLPVVTAVVAAFAPLLASSLMQVAKAFLL